ncbi:MAG: hypothetical protein J6S23_03210 [Clostridia bacterium]|nr:hypothetical protein [Clostridia bacterium]
MKENVGKTIKTIANVCYIIGMILSIIAGLILATDISGAFILISIIGPLVLLAPYYMMFGFGEIIIKLYEIEENTRSKDVKGKKGKKRNNSQVEESSNENYDEEIFDDDFDDSIPKITCPDCHTNHDFDYPKCPNCGHKYEE